MDAHGQARRPARAQGKSVYEQVVEIMRTESTFRRCSPDVDEEALAEADGGFVRAVALAPGCSSSPVISTLCPICEASWALVASSLYSFSALDALPVVPAASRVELSVLEVLLGLVLLVDELIVACCRM